MNSQSYSYMSLGSVAIWFPSSEPLTLVQDFFIGRLELTRNEIEVQSNMQNRSRLNYQLLFQILSSSNIVYKMLKLTFPVVSNCICHVILSTMFYDILSAVSRQARRSLRAPPAGGGANERTYCHYILTGL